MPGTENIEREVENILGEDTPASESAAEEKEEAQTPPEDTTPSKSEEEKAPSEEKIEEKTEKEEKTGEDQRFDKHPRFQKLIQERDIYKQERDEALREAQSSAKIKEVLGDMDLDELNKLMNARGLLNKYPKLREQIQKSIDEYPYGNEEVKGEFDSIKSEIAKDRTERLLEKYDNMVDKLISDKKIDKDNEELVKEMLHYRVSRSNINDLNQVPKIFDSVVKDLEKVRRGTLAKHIEDKSKENGIPPTTKSKSKHTIASKKEESTEDVINDIASELKKSSSNFGEE